MEKNNGENIFILKILAVLFFLFGIYVGVIIGSAIDGKSIDNKDKEIEELKMENAVLKEENQDIMGLWSDLVIEKK